MKKVLLAAALILTSSASFANFNDEVNDYKHIEHGLLASQGAQVSAMAKLSQANASKNNKLAAHFLHLARDSFNGALPHGGKVADGAILFVSFSMPASLIIDMANQAQSLGIAVIIRGLVDNKMPQTLQRIMDLKRLAKSMHKPFSGIGIDPVWFEQFHITAVPALVVTRRPAGCIAQSYCKDQPFDVVYGNAPISESLKEIASRGSKVPAGVAKRILKRVQS